MARVNLMERSDFVRSADRAFLYADFALANWLARGHRAMPPAAIAHKIKNK
jgi:hypothetical protein